MSFLGGHARYLVEEQGEHDRRREAEDELQQADHDGIAEHLPEARETEEVAEVLEPHPGAPQDPRLELVVLEGDEKAVHGGVVEDDVVDEPG